MALWWPQHTIRVLHNHLKWVFVRVASSSQQQKAVVPFPVIACASHSKFVKSLQAKAWFVNFTIYLWFIFCRAFDIWASYASRPSTFKIVEQLLSGSFRTTLKMSLCGGGIVISATESRALFPSVVKNFVTTFCFESTLGILAYLVSCSEIGKTKWVSTA